MEKKTLKTLAANHAIVHFGTLSVAMATNSPGLEGDTSGVPEGRKYTNVLRPPTVLAKMIPMKPIAYLRGEPRVIWEEEEME